MINETNKKKKSKKDSEYKMVRIFSSLTTQALPVRKTNDC